MSVHDYPSRISGACNPRNKYHPARDIINEVAEKHELTVDELKSTTRARRIAWPRQEAMLRLRDETAMSLPQIAEKLGLKDHTTVLHGIRAASERVRLGITTG